MHGNYYEGHAVTFRLSGDVSSIADDAVRHAFLERSPSSPLVLHYIIPAYLHRANEGCDTAAEECSKEKVGIFGFFFWFAFFFPPSMPTKVQPVKIKLLCLHRFNWLKIIAFHKYGL